MAGPNTATVTLNYDDGGRCTAQNIFDSATSGSLTLTCDDGWVQTMEWRTVETPATGFAPADLAAFDARFVGKRWVAKLDVPEPNMIDVHFISSGRLEEYEEGERTERGTYTYHNTGPNTGNLGVRYIDSDGLGPLHTLHVTFDSATADTFSVLSEDGSSLITGSWRVADVPGT